MIKHLGFNNGSSSFDCDSLLDLILHIIHYEECIYENLLLSCNFKPIWSLFFNPLIIKSACTSDGNLLEDLKKSDIARVPFNAVGSSIDVIWSDERKSENRTNYKRKTINFIIEK